MTTFRTFTYFHELCSFVRRHVSHIIRIAENKSVHTDGGAPNSCSRATFLFYFIFFNLFSLLLYIPCHPLPITPPPMYITWLIVVEKAQSGRVNVPVIAGIDDDNVPTKISENEIHDRHPFGPRPAIEWRSFSRNNTDATRIRFQKFEKYFFQFETRVRPARVINIARIKNTQISNGGDIIIT